MDPELIKTWITPLVIGVLAGWVSRPLWLIVSGFLLQVIDLLPINQELVASVRGTWRNTFYETNERGENVESYETLRLYQVGRLVWGVGHREDDPSVQFKYRGKLLRNTFIGTYRVPKRKSPVGRGAFEMSVHNNEQSMSGHCIWHDHDTDKIEHSGFCMKKVK